MCIVLIQSESIIPFGYWEKSWKMKKSKLWIEFFFISSKQRNGTGPKGTKVFFCSNCGNFLMIQHVTLILIVGTSLSTQILDKNLMLNHIKKSCLTFYRIWTNLNPLWVLKKYDSSKSIEGKPPFCILSCDGRQESECSVFSKNGIDTKPYEFLKY